MIEDAVISEGPAGLIVLSDGPDSGKGKGNEWRAYLVEKRQARRVVSLGEAERLFPEDGSEVLLILDRPLAERLEQARASCGTDGYPRWALLVLGDIPEGDDYVVVTEENPSPALLVLAMNSARKLYRARKEALRAKGDLQTLAALVSHDLRSPMTSILTLAYLLREGAAAERGKTTEFSQSIIDSTDELGRMIDRLCFLGRLKEPEDGKKAVAMGEVFQEGLRRARRESGSRAPVEAPALWPEVEGIETWLGTIWEHLLSNALLHAGKDSCVRAGWETRAGKIHYWIEDNGSGVDPDRRENLLRPFHQMHLPGSPKKLGLPIAQRLIERMGGKLFYYPCECGGSRFEFTLQEPRKAAVVLVEEEAPGAKPWEPKESWLAPGRD